MSPLRRIIINKWEIVEWDLYDWWNERYLDPSVKTRVTVGGRRWNGTFESAIEMVAKHSQSGV